MFTSKSTRNYEGKKVFIGIDVHKRTMSAYPILNRLSISQALEFQQFMQQRHIFIQSFENVMVFIRIEYFFIKSGSYLLSYPELR